MCFQMAELDSEANQRMELTSSHPIQLAPKIITQVLGRASGCRPLHPSCSIIILSQ